MSTVATIGLRPGGAHYSTLEEWEAWIDGEEDMPNNSALLLDEVMPYYCQSEQDAEVRMQMYRMARSLGMDPNELIASLQRSVIDAPPPMTSDPTPSRQPRKIRLKN